MPIYIDCKCMIEMYKNQSNSIKKIIWTIILISNIKKLYFVIKKNKKFILFLENHFKIIV